ncbi:MAG: T9SS type A sorting domain-containing protein, partial [Bacteroidota bacterium]
CLLAKNLEDTTAIRIDTTGFPVEFINTNLQVLDYEYREGAAIISRRVWPGDANIDGLVNHKDLLNIGLGFGLMGPNRAGASINWEGQFSASWGQVTPGSNVNYKFADTNGDGLLNEFDLEAIEQNWTRTYDLPGAAGAIGLVRSNDGPPLYTELDTLFEGAFIEFPILLGTADEPVSDVYSIAFTLSYDPKLVEPGSFDFQLDDSWLAEAPGDLLMVFREFPNQGKVEIAITRKDGKNISGYGQIARGGVTIEDVIFTIREEEQFNFTFEDIVRLDAQERSGETRETTTTTVVESTTQTINILSEDLIQVYPNPVQDQLWIKNWTNLDIQNILVHDLQGRLLLSQDELINDRLDTQFLGNGLYTMKLLTKEGIIIKKFTKNQ